MSPSEQKRFLRAEAQALRDAMSAGEQRERSLRIAETVLRHELFLRADTVMAYACVRSEADLWPVIAAAMDQKKRVLLPVCRPGRMMEACVYDGRMRRGMMDISEPMGSPVPPEEIDLILTPGLLFTCAGIRLGYGGGFFDRFFPRTNAARAGIAYQMQIVDALPHESHDRTMNVLLTEDKYYHCGCGGETVCMI